MTLRLFMGLMMFSCLSLLFFFFNDTATTEIYTLSLHDALPIYGVGLARAWRALHGDPWTILRSEEHTSELQSHVNLVCRLLLEKKKKHRLIHAVGQEKDRGKFKKRLRKPK